MAKVFIAVVPYTEAEKMVIDKLKGFKSSCVLGEFVGYNANFYEVATYSKRKAQKLIDKIISKRYSMPGLCGVTLAENYVKMEDFIEHSVGE